MKRLIVAMLVLGIVAAGVTLVSCSTTGGKSGAGGGEIRHESTPDAGSGSKSQPNAPSSTGGSGSRY